MRGEITLGADGTAASVDAAAAAAAAGAMTLQWDAVVAGSITSRASDGDTADSAPADVASGVAFGVLRAADGSTLTLSQSGALAGAAVAALEARLRAHVPPLCLGPSVCVRAFVDEDLVGTGADGTPPLVPGALRAALAAAVSAAGPWECAPLVLPVRRVLAPGGRARLAVQLQFTVHRAEPCTAPEAAKLVEVA